MRERRAPQPTSCPPTEEETRRYHLEDALTRCEALVNDVQRQMLRAAMNGGVTAEGRRDMKLKLEDAAASLDRLPIRSK